MKSLTGCSRVHYVFTLASVMHCTQSFVRSAGVVPPDMPLSGHAPSAEAHPSTHTPAAATSTALILVHNMAGSCNQTFINIRLRSKLKTLLSHPVTQWHSASDTPLALANSARACVCLCPCALYTERVQLVTLRTRGWTVDRPIVTATRLSGQALRILCRKAVVAL
jgi:hypothetical protein